MLINIYNTKEVTLTLYMASYYKKQNIYFLHIHIYVSLNIQQFQMEVDSSVYFFYFGHHKTNFFDWNKCTSRFAYVIEVLKLLLKLRNVIEIENYFRGQNVFSL